jgi:hypothetical protein
MVVFRRKADDAGVYLDEVRLKAAEGTVQRMQGWSVLHWKARPSMPVD